jgi:hypothetical protein
LKKTGVPREEKGIYLSSEDPLMQKFINKTSKLDSQNPKKSYEYDRLAGKQFAVMGLDKFWLKDILVFRITERSHIHNCTKFKHPDPQQSKMPLKRNNKWYCT